jgi:hypothetical protein
MYKDARSSFIAFAYISRVSIKASVGNKRMAREAIPDREFQEHFDTLKKSKLTERFDLIFCVDQTATDWKKGGKIS